MVVRCLNTIAYKCPVCGSVEFNDISVFDFFNGKEYAIKCSCGRSAVKIITKVNKKCHIIVPCIACGCNHTYVLDLKVLLAKGILVFECANTNMELLFIGKDEEVRQSVDRYEMKMEKILSDIGYEDSFANSAVMLRTIDIIHDIAEKGDLLCQCGSRDIDLQILYDKVQLSCNKCFAYEFINACTNQDLKQTLCRGSIVLCRDTYRVAPCKSE
ncbi:MAG: hypothetical protein GX066_01495 [Clostridiaceae bacterium]|nr:hypothetical protein [Clostridiaceae bacterium]